jgi:hypothetical protein
MPHLHEINSEPREDFGEIICRIASFKARGLTTFQAMAASLEDADWDRVFSFMTAATIVLAQFVVDEDDAAMLQAARKLTKFANGKPTEAA